MEEKLEFNGKTYISSKRAAQVSGYTKDYIGQLCRGGKLDAKLVGRNWYIAEDALESTQKRRNYVVPGQSNADVNEQTEKGAEPDATADDIDSEEIAAGRETDTGPTSVQIDSEQGDEECDVPIIAPEHAISLRDEMSPAKLEQFALTRAPSKFELDRKFRQDSLLTNMHVLYEGGMPVFYNDDRPLMPTPDRPRGSSATSTITKPVPPITGAPSKRFAAKFNGVYSPKMRFGAQMNRTAPPIERQTNAPLVGNEVIRPNPAPTVQSRPVPQQSVKSPLSDEFAARAVQPDTADAASLKVAASILFLAVAVAGAIAVFSMSRVSEFENVATPESAFYDGRN